MNPLAGDPALALATVRTLMALGILVTTSEHLGNWRDYADSGMSGWNLLRKGLARHDLGRVQWSVLALSAPAPFMCWLGLRLWCAALLLLPGLPPTVELGALVALFVTDLLISQRIVFGKDGSDRMLRSLNMALLLVALVPGDARVLEAGLAFIALHACLAYFATGVWKAKGRQWRSGEAVFLVFNTRSHGTPAVAAVLARQPRLTRLLSWSVIGMEVLFPLALVGGTPVALVFLGWGVVFHATNTWMMGLNHFFFAFVATYPAILYCAGRWGLLP